VLFVIEPSSTTCFRVGLGTTGLLIDDLRLE